MQYQIIAIYKSNSKKLLQTLKMLYKVANLTHCNFDTHIKFTLRVYNYRIEMVNSNFKSANFQSLPNIDHR